MANLVLHVLDEPAHVDDVRRRLGHRAVLLHLRVSVPKSVTVHSVSGVGKEHRNRARVIELLFRVSLCLIVRLD